MDKFYVHTAQNRPDLWKVLEDPTHPLNAAWPLFLDQDIYFQHYCSQLNKNKAFACFQYAIVKLGDYAEEQIIACGRSIPFYWPELAKVGGKMALAQHPKVLHTLPDEGYDAILSRGFEQHFAREGIAPDTDRPAPFNDPAAARTEQPNALSAISITVSPEHPSRGLAEALIMAMKQTVIERNFDAMVVPLRPTRKSEFPMADMTDYVLWRATIVANHTPSMTVRKPDPSLPFDPWLRKHARLGGKVIKVARRSMRVEGRVEEWQQWTGVNIPQTARQQGGSLKQEAGSGKAYVEVAVPRGLVPLRYYVDEQRCVYIEPNFSCCGAGS
ncbi:hypothetical protein BDV38DRAFT_276307 [Aspergillus pseudotamarii]|uniref:Uncharacterized protein n=1 Tax=Aspergillus pseudotamarii TaxID=132259 RepID=A0A5N6S8N3_ASPPS|nr:uncharacterized protein BDV38DRAFT_276307 [Aspergillus pseudotamarii]KAE8131036.1 hypothetical protein BDV38DRAFT_276307 [Aspergillus pseudotamarii]